MLVMEHHSARMAVVLGIRADSACAVFTLLNEKQCMMNVHCNALINVIHVESFRTLVYFVAWRTVTLSKTNLPSI